MATSILYGNTWVGTTDPTTPVWPGQEWVNPDLGTIARRNTSDTAWVVIGSINEQTAVQKSGDAMTGPLVDVPNLAPIESPDFQSTAQLGGLNLATELSLSRLRRTLLSYIETTVREQFLSQTKLSGTAANVAAGFTIISHTIAEWNETYTDGVVFPAPVFSSDKVQATPGQIVAWDYFLAGLYTDGNSNLVTLSSPAQMKVKAVFGSFNSESRTQQVPIGVFCLAVR